MHSGWKRVTSAEKMSIPGAPVTTQSASARPNPPVPQRPPKLSAEAARKGVPGGLRDDGAPEYMMPAEFSPQPTKNPRSSGHSPISGLWSGVNDSGPQTVDWIPTVPTAGTRLMCASRWTPNTS